MSGQQFTLSSANDCHADGLVVCGTDRLPDEPFQLPASIAVIVGLSGALWGVVWYVGHNIMGL